MGRWQPLLMQGFFVVVLSNDYSCHYCYSLQHSLTSADAVPNDSQCPALAGLLTCCPSQFTAMQIPNRFHNSGKRPKARLKPQAKRSRKAALKALKLKLGA
jgi:hypothetical protein